MLKKLNISKRNTDETKLFIREPVDKICRKIEDSNQKQIILGSRSGIGKTTILDNLENRNIGFNPFISMKFDSMGWGINEEQDKRIFCDLKYCFNLLSYIKNYYPLTYYKYFQSIYEETCKLSETFINYINNCLYGAIFEEKVVYKERVAAIIKMMHEKLECETITIGIDRFDWTNNSDENTQKYLQEYFELFDKVIITTDDSDDKKINDFACFEPTYSSDVEIVKEIITRRINLQNKQENSFKFDPDCVSIEIYEMLIQKTNGNISLMLEIFNEVINRLSYGENLELEKIFNNECKQKIEEHKEIRILDKKPQLYIR